MGTRGLCGNARPRPLWEHTAGRATRGAGRATRGRYGNARPIRERAAGTGTRGWCGNGTEKVGYLVLTQENLIFLESLSGDISIPANCILAHFSVLYT